jgi:hypothetical protein
MSYHSTNFSQHERESQGNIRANFINSPAFVVFSVFFTVTLTALLLIVGITHFSLMESACVAIFMGGLVGGCLWFIMGLIQRGANTYAVVIHAVFEWKRSQAIYLADPNRVVIHDDAPVHVEAVRQIQENHTFTEGAYLPEQAASLIKAPPFRRLLPTIEQIARQNENLPLREKKWYIGHDLEGKAIIGKFYDVRACGFGGAQGQGKTSNMVNFAYQGHAYGFGLVIFDPHMHNEEGLVPRLASLRSSFVKPPVGEDREAMYQQFEWLQSQYEQRKRPGGMKYVQTLMVLVDEWNELLRTLRGDAGQRKRILEITLNLIQGGRKHGIFPFVAAQNWQNETIGGADLRYAFPTRISHRAETPAMKLLLNCTEKQLDELCDPPLQTMDALITTANGELYRYCIPRPELEDGAACDEIRLRVKAGFPQVSMNRPTSILQEEMNFPASEPTDDFGSAPSTVSVPSSEPSHCRNENTVLQFHPPVDSMEPETELEPNKISKKEVVEVMRLDAKGTKASDIYKSLWNVQGKGRAYVNAAARLRKIRMIIASQKESIAQEE